MLHSQCALNRIECIEPAPHGRQAHANMHHIQCPTGCEEKMIRLLLQKNMKEN